MSQGFSCIIQFLMNIHHSTVVQHNSEAAKRISLSTLRKYASNEHFITSDAITRAFAFYQSDAVIQLALDEFDESH